MPRPETLHGLCGTVCGTVCGTEKAGYDSVGLVDADLLPVEVKVQRQPRFYYED